MSEGPQSQHPRERLWWSLLLGAPLILGIGVMALAQRGVFGTDAEVGGAEPAAAVNSAGAAFDDHGERGQTGPGAPLTRPAVAGTEANPPDPPDPPGDLAIESRAVPLIAPPAKVGANRFPEVAAPLVPKPDAVRGIYLNAWAAGSSRRRAQLLKLAAESEINTFVIDVKEAGEVSYRSGVALARAIGADRSYIPNPRRLLSELRAAGIYPIARIVIFKDPILALHRPDWAIQGADGTLWRDNRDEFWVDPYNREVWDYNIALAREAVLLGFSEVQWDYVRFPDVPARFMRSAVFPARAGRSRAQAIREFLRYSREALADLGVPITADVFGLTVSVQDDLGIGQNWEQMADVTDALLPMVYPSHFAKGSYGIPVPNADPYQTVRTALEYAVRRSATLDGAATIRPWLQDFSLGWPSYGPAEVRAQIQATYDAGLTEWILWNPGSRYTAAALAPRDGEPPDLPIPRHTPLPILDTLRSRYLDKIPFPVPLGVPARPRPVRPDSVGRGGGE